MRRTMLLKFIDQSLLYVGINVRQTFRQLLEAPRSRADWSTQVSR